MNINNILSEGILDKILRSILPNILKDKSSKSYIKAKEKKIQNLKKQKEESEKRLQVILHDLNTKLDSELERVDKELKKKFPDKYKSFDKNKVKKSVMG